VVLVQLALLAHLVLILFLALFHRQVVAVAAVVLQPLQYLVALVVALELLVLYSERKAYQDKVMLAGLVLLVAFTPEAVVVALGL
jgi:hypothetical protein